MSAFVIDRNTMEKCVRAICAEGRYGKIVRLFDGTPTDDPDAMTNIGRRLFALNIVACEERYPDCKRNPDSLPGPCDTEGRSTALETAASFFVNAPRFRPVPMSQEPLVAGYKAMTCLRYQCSEGNVPDTALFKELARAIGEIACAIVEALPEYEAAPWG